MQSITKPGVSIFSSVRTQLMVVAVFSVILAVVITQFVTITTTRSKVEAAAADDLQAISDVSAVSMSNLIGEQVGLLQVLSNNRGLELRVRQQSDTYEGDTEAIINNIVSLDEQWATAADTSPLVQGLLNRDVSNSLREFQQNFPDHVEVFATDRYGALVAATNRTSNYDQSSEEWWRRAWNNGQGAIYISPEPVFDESADTYSLLIAVPVEDQDGVIGVVRTTYSFASVQALVSRVTFGETGHIALVNSDGLLLAAPGLVSAEPLSEDIAELVEAGADAEENRVLSDEQGRASFARVSPVSSGGTLAPLDSLGWSIVTFEGRDEVLAPATESLEAVALPVIGIMILMIFVGYLLARRFTRPIERLRQAAQQMIHQRWDTRVDIRQKNEFGELAYTFNIMAGQLQGFVDEMEARIQERTRDLQAVVDVSNQISTLLDPNRLLQDVVDLTKERFRLYHAHIYLLDENGENLVLAAGAGHVGRQMVSEKRSIAIQNMNSVVATAGRTGESVIVNDVNLSATFLPHPLLPDTRSEMAVPLIARGQLVGVLDIQSDQPNFFAEQTLTVVETLATQIAVAINNAILYQVAERTSRHERALGTITQRLQGATNVEEVLQVTVRELGKALRVPHTAVQLEMLPESEN